MARKGATEDVCNEVVQHLLSGDYLDDERFAIEWVENRAEFRPKGIRLLAAELRAKGISTEFIANALVSYNEEEAARKVARKASSRFAHLPWETYQKKFVGYLSRRGFQYSLARSLAQTTWEEQTSVDESEVDT
jgi:regulatory protein